MTDAAIIEVLRAQNADLRREVAELEQLNIVAVNNAVDAERSADDADQVKRLAEALRDTLNEFLRERHH